MYGSDWKKTEEGGGGRRGKREGGGEGGEKIRYCCWFYSGTELRTAATVNVDT